MRQHGLRLFVGLLLPMLSLLGLPTRAEQITVVENARILTLEEGRQDGFFGFLAFDEQGIIRAIGRGYFGDGEFLFDPETGEQRLAPQALIKIDAQGMILMPGFVSGHNHLWQSAFRGLAGDGVLWPWLEALHRTYAPHFREGDQYWFTLHGALSQLEQGITTSFNHSQRLGDRPDSSYLEQLQASLDAPQHFIFAYEPNLALSIQKVKEDFSRFVNRVEALAGRSPMLAGAVSATGAYRAPELLALELELAREAGFHTQTHLLEQYSRREGDRASWKAYQAAAAIGPDVSYAHFIHPSDSILEEVAERKGAMIWNPLSNGRLGSGLADIPRYLSMGIGVGMGVDGQASADTADPFENMRMGLYALRMRDRNTSGLQPIDLLRLHTLSTASVLGVADQVGSLELGKQADFLLVDPGDPLTGPVFDLPAHLVLAVDGSNIHAVYVGGKRVVVNGKAVSPDRDRVIYEVSKRVAELRNRVALSRANGP